jgi:ribose transport system substrate-binding protein
MNKLPALVVSLAAASLLMAGCKQESSPGASTATTNAAARPATHAIAVVTKLTNTVFWQSMHSGAQAAGKELGYEIQWSGPDRETNIARQIALVDEAIVRGVDGVVLSPVDRTEMVPSVKKLSELNVPCVIVDSGVETQNFVSFVSTYNSLSGEMAARRMGEILDGKGNVIVVRHLEASQATIKRVSGFCQTLSNEFPNIKIVDSQSGQDTAETAKAATEEMLKRNPDVQGLFACNVDVSVGALQALQVLKRMDVKMVAYDPHKLLLDGLRAGQVDSIVVQNPYKMGYESVKAVVAHIKGQPVPKMMDTGVEIVTMENLTEPNILRLLGEQQ